MLPVGGAIVDSGVVGVVDLEGAEELRQHRVVADEDGELDELALTHDLADGGPRRLVGHAVANEVAGVAENGGELGRERRT